MANQTVITIDGAAIGVADSVQNTTIVDVIGNKEDAANNTADEASIIGLLRYLLANAATASDTSDILGALTDSAVDTTNTATVVNLLRQIAEVVNNGTGTAIGANLSLVDLIGAFDGGADPQGDIFQALGVDTTNSVKDHFDDLKGAGWVDENLTTIDANVDTVNTNIGDPSGDTITDLSSKLGDIARSLDLILGSRWDSSGDLGTDIATLISSTGGGGTITGTSDSGTAGTLIDAVLTQGDDYFNGMVLVMTSGNNVGLARPIVDFDAATDTVTIEPDFPNAIATDTYAIMPRSAFAEILLGNNNADNVADTTNVVANEDGSVLERLEQIQEAINKGTGTAIPANTSLYDITGGFSGDGGANQDDSIKASLDLAHTDLDNALADIGDASASTLGNIYSILGNPGTDSVTEVIGQLADAASDAAGTATIIALLRQIAEVVNNGSGTAANTNKSLVDMLGTNGSTVTDSAVSVLGAVGANNANNAFDSSTVVANVDGSVLERLEHIITQLLAGGDIHDVLYADAAGASLAADILTANTNLGDASGDTLVSTNAKLGDLASDLATLLGTLQDLGGGADIANNFNDIAGATFDTATDSNEAIRDQLDTLIGTPVSDVATEIAAIDTVVDAIKTVTDNLPNSGALTDLATAAANGSSDSTSTYDYLDAGGEQDVVEITTTTRKIIKGVWLDLVNMTQDGTIKVYHKIDGTNYREVKGGGDSFTVATDPDGIFLNLDMGITADFKVTYTEGADEGATRTIPYSIVYELKE